MKKTNKNAAAYTCELTMNTRVPIILIDNDVTILVFIQNALLQFCIEMVIIPFAINPNKTIQYMIFKYMEIEVKEKRETLSTLPLIFCAKNGKIRNIATLISRRPKIKSQ